jgi:hypothetical protein
MGCGLRGTGRKMLGAERMTQGVRCGGLQGVGRSVILS